MEAVVLSWRATGAGGPTVRAAGLATALAAAGARVRVVTRLADGEAPPRLRGCEVHAVPDAPPIAPVGLDGGAIARLAFAGTALAVVARRLREQPADVVVASGRDVVDAAVRLPGRAPLLVDPGPAGPELVSSDLRRAPGPLLLAAPTSSAAVAWRGGDDEVRLLPASAPAPRRAPARPRADAPVRLVAATPAAHRAAADGLRSLLARRGDRRVVTRLDRRRPAIVVVLDPGATDAVLRAAVRRAPVVAVEGPAGDVVTDLACGLVVAGEEEALGVAADLLTDDRATADRLGDAGPAACERAREAAVSAVAAVVADHVPEARRRLRAIG